MSGDDPYSFTQEIPDQNDYVKEDVCFLFSSLKHNKFFKVCGSNCK